MQSPLIDFLDCAWDALMSRSRLQIRVNPFFLRYKVPCSRRPLSTPRTLLYLAYHNSSHRALYYSHTSELLATLSSPNFSQCQNATSPPLPLGPILPNATVRAAPAVHPVAPGPSSSSSILLRPPSSLFRPPTCTEDPSKCPSTGNNGARSNNK